MDRDRRLSYLILKDVEEDGSWSNLAVSKRISAEGADSPAFVRELVYGVIRSKLLLDYNIDLFLKKPGIKSSERIWLQMGFYQLGCMDGVKPYAAISETVALAKSFKKGSEGFINAVLRSFQRSGCRLQYPDKSDIVRYLSVKYSADESIVSLWMKAYGEAKAEELLAASMTPAPLALRVNPLKCTKEELTKDLKAKGFEVCEGGLSKDCIIAKGSGLLDTEEYRDGFFSVQGESSQFAVSVLAPSSGSVVLDLCAAPGGKTCAMAEMMKDRGKILAFDYYEHRVKLIKKEAKRLGLSIIEAAVGDAAVFNKELEGTADFALCDVPCSGLGTLRENPEIKLRPVSKITVQRVILENAFAYVKKGGRVLYSTCTVNPEENEKVTEGFNVIYQKQLFTEVNGPDGFYVCLIEK